MSLKVSRVSPAASVQGPPLSGFRRYGVPPGGAFDQESMTLANALLRNAPSAPVLEVPLAGAVLECVEATTVSLVGAESTVKLNGEVVGIQCRARLAAGDILEIGPCVRGVRVYLTVPGGIVLEGDVILAGAEGSLPPARLASAPDSLDGGILRFVRAPQSESFDLARFQATEFTVSPISDRKGVRLIGQCEGRVEELPSEPSCIGAIQVTPSSEPIVIGPDGPTIGGYPKIGVVISADHNSLGQLAPGAKLAFEQVSLEEAQALYQEQRRGLSRKLAQLSWSGSAF